MSNPTYIKLTGWVTRDPELRRTTSNNTPVCTIRLGTANRWPDRNTGEWREGPASYFDVVCWRSLAVNVAASLRKGHMVTIHGTFRNRIWTDKDNNGRTTLEITASSVGHELTYGWSHFNRTQRASSSAEGELAVGEASRATRAAPMMLAFRRRPRTRRDWRRSRRQLRDTCPAGAAVPHRNVTYPIRCGTPTCGFCPEHVHDASMLLPRVT